MDSIDTDKGLINMAQVARAREVTSKGDTTWILYDADGNTLGQTHAKANDLDRVRIEGTLVSAPPGYTIVYVTWDEGPIYWEEPIVAFYVSGYCTTPVTVEGPVSTNDTYGVKQPNGITAVPMVGNFPTLEEFWAYALAEREGQIIRTKMAAAKRAAGKT